MTSRTIEIQADPRKRFFIDMLTRDINLVDCILDLIDNSIDSILHKTKFDPMKGLSNEERKKLDKYKISIKFNEAEFTIEDNSDGVGAKDIAERVFRFGAEKNPQKKMGLSVYGIGMKRAFFKIGRLIEFKSVSKKEAVSVNLNVDKWVDDEENWDLSGKQESIQGTALSGTKITITKINSETAPNFKSSAFETRLIEKLQTTYGIFLGYGLVIKVNNKNVERKMPTVSQSSKIKVSSKLFNKDGVQIKIIAGISPDDDKRSNGWFIFCNGRMILEGDKTPNTGWGNGFLRKFHSSTNRFVGFVYFKSEDVNLLPWTTTKNGVNFESSVYQYALVQMVKIARPIVSFLVKKYQQDKSMREVDDMTKDAKDTPVSEIKKGEGLFDPDIKSLSGKNKENEITYTVPLKDIKKVKKALQDDEISNSEIGKKTFYYFLDHEE